MRVCFERLIEIFFSLRTGTDATYSQVMSVGDEKYVNRGWWTLLEIKWICPHKTRVFQRKKTYNSSSKEFWQSTLGITIRKMCRRFVIMARMKIPCNCVPWYFSMVIYVNKPLQGLRRLHCKVAWRWVVARSLGLA